MQDRTINNALLAIWRKGGEQAGLALPLLNARGVPLLRHVQTMPMTRGRCARFVMGALSAGPMTAPELADSLQGTMQTPRRSALNRVYCCLVRLEANGPGA